MEISKYFLLFVITARILFPEIIFAEPVKSNTSCSCGKISKRAMLIASNQTISPDMAWIPSGMFLMGGMDKDTKPDELPRHEVKVNGFYMDKTEVTNKQFEEFVKRTHYITTAEKPVDWEILKQQLPPDIPKPSAEQLLPGSLVFVPSKHPVDLNNPGLWWKWVTGANWRHPLGPKSKMFGSDHPVVHISWFDANAYCKWAGKRLPTEAEREWAARGGLRDKSFPWGSEDIDSGKIKANTWQGHFPNQNTLRDHFYWTSPVLTFPPNQYGLYDMAGNVWEWTADRYHANYYAAQKKLGIVMNPTGPKKSFDPDEPDVEKYVLRGGSFLCNKSYCTGYRVSARMKNSPDTSLVNAGFRCVRDEK